MALLKPTTKMMTADENKAIDAPADAALTLYREDDGWRPVYNRLGDRVGFYHRAAGFKDDPATIRVPDPDPITVQIFASPEVIAAETARDAAAAQYKAISDELSEAMAKRNRLRKDLSDNPPRMMYACKMDAANRSNGTLESARTLELAAAERRVAQLNTDLIDHEPVYRKAAAYNDLVRRMGDRLRAG